VKSHICDTRGKPIIIMDRRKIFLVLMAFVCLGTFAQTIKQNGVTYVIKGTEAYIKNFDPKATSIIIEGEITYKSFSYNVVGFTGRSFQQTDENKKLMVRELVFSKSCTEIMRYTASYMVNLRKVVMLGPVTKIGERAFENCKQLREINIPPTVTEIDNGAFSSCESIESIQLPDKLEKLGWSVFSGSGLKSIVIPKSVVEMGPSVFSYCHSLSSAIFLNMPRLLESGMFQGCISLTSLVLPNSLKEVGASAFAGCKRLVSLVLPDKARYFTEREAQAKNQYDHATFYGCVQLANLIKHDGTVPTGMEKYMPDNCPFVMNGSKPEDVGFEQSMLAAVNAASKGISAESISTTQFVQSDVDVNIPQGEQNSTTTYAVIIGNERYKNVPPVSFAEHDAKIFSQYCMQTLGLPSKNVSVYTNASYAEMIKAIRQIKQVAKVNNGNLNIIFYYSGHGIPSEETKDAYLLPVDADGTMMEVCYSINKLYADLSSTNAKNIITFMDACFSGAQRDGGVLQASARGVAIKTKTTSPQKNMIVFCAASGEETAYPYKEKGHGMFTYYLLKKLQETEGNVTMGELSDYVKMEVLKSSITENQKSQTPTISVSPELKAGWYNMPIR